ncbi:MAG: aminotransferase class I/II-fold pyridoxal phosphate-dependent enzyme, partial [Actinobacteria bacterium]|nr:aminotransferase class I/II-fold pyridoxal phosphate-dependent enzyme [Actinomycetota bacterium]
VEVSRSLQASQGYSDSQGITSARTSIVQHYQNQGIDITDIDDVWLGNGVSELIQLSLNALLSDGDEVLIPAPDYPLWTASTTLAGGTPVHYLCDEDNEWNPDIDDLRSKITDRTKAIVVINPNNPTGAVYSREILRQIADIAVERNLIVFADEIYDKILYDDAVHHTFAGIAPDVFTITFNGLSKAYRLAGFRSGWMVMTGPREHAASYIEGVVMLTNMRLCANVPGQHAIQTALGGRQSIKDLILPGGRLLEQRDAAIQALDKIPGVTCVVPKGALYVFPKLDPEMYPIADDRRFVLDFLRAERVLVVQGTGFNWPRPDHLRIVTLPWAKDLTEAIDRLGNFLSTYQPPKN